MAVLRRILGVVVMGAGVIGLLLSLGGLVGLVVARPALVSTVTGTVNALTANVEISQKTLEITGGALDATNASVDSLAEMKEGNPIVAGQRGIGDKRRQTCENPMKWFDCRQTIADFFQGKPMEFPEKKPDGKHNRCCRHHRPEITLQLHWLRPL